MKAVCAVLLCVAAGVALVAAVDHDSRKASAKASRLMRARAAHQSQAMSKADAALMTRLQKVVAATKAGQMSMAGAWAATQLAAGFEGYEHAVGSGWGAEAQAADLIPFKFIDGKGTHNDPFKITDMHTGNRCLESDDSVKMGIAELTAIAGDYFGPKWSESAIICTDAIRGRQQSGIGARFTEAFEDLWHNPVYGARGSGKWQHTMVYLMNQLRAMIGGEQRGVDQNRAEPNTKQSPNTNPSSRWYNRADAPQIGIVQDAITLFWKGKKEGIGAAEGNVKALGVNDDHFGSCADETYGYGAKLATDLAFAAGGKWRANDKAGAKADLNRAYGMLAFVSHYLSDRFSAGHMRTPRIELRDVCVSMLSMAPMAGLTANVMHDEDNWNCVFSTNKLHHKWWVCGDHRFFDLENAQNRRILHDAIKAAVKEVSDAFEAGVNGGANPTAAGGWEAAGLKYVPTTAGLTEREGLENTCPMFKVVPLPNHKRDVHHRVDADRLHGIPRPPAAITNGYGKSIRYTMSAALFPQYVDVTSVQNADLTQAVPVALPPLATDCTYESMGSIGSFCCASMTRATPQPSHNDASGDAVGTDSHGKAIADGSTLDPANKAKRMTWINACANVQADLQHPTNPGHNAQAVPRVAVNAVTTGTTHVVNTAYNLGAPVVSGTVGVTKWGAGKAWEGLKCVGTMCANAGQAILDASG